MDDPVLRAFLEEVQPLRHRIERIVLFGSRARGDHRPYSDYDLLVVVPRKDRDLVDALYEATMAVLYRTERLVSLKIYRKGDFDRLTAMATPFLTNVMREGVPLG